MEAQATEGSTGDGAPKDRTLDKGTVSMELYRPHAPSQMEFHEADLRLLKETLTQDLSASEFELFVRVCQHTGLDPFHKQIHAIKRKGRLTIQTSIDGYRLIADRTGCYAPGRPSTYTYDDDGKLESATAYVKKLVAGTWHEVAETAYWSEYYPGGGREGFMWRKIPHVMLAKVAEARALRRAFPAELSGVYTDDEMDQAATGVGASAGASQVPPSRPSPETKNPSPGGPTISEAQRKRLWAIAKNEGGFTDEGVYRLIGVMGYEHTSDILRSDYEVICEGLRREEYAAKYNRDPNTRDMFEPPDEVSRGEPGPAPYAGEDWTEDPPAFYDE